MSSVQNKQSSFDKKLFKIANVLDRIEQGFNIPGSIPLVAIGSGVLRAGFGATEIVAGVATGILLSGASGLCKDKETAGKLRDLASFSFQVIEHGALNIYRGLGAEALATGVMVIGMFAMLPANKDSPNGSFMPYLSNREIAEEVINDRDSQETRWYAPMDREKERVIQYLMDEFNLL